MIKTMTELVSTPAVPGFLAHAGQMGALIGLCDWSAHPLKGPPQWPDTLKCVLATTLGSPRPMYILWGPEFLFFCNDAYAPLLSARLDGAMGRSFPHVLPERWGDFEPMVRQALAGHESKHENMPVTLIRDGYPESTWWTFSYICLRDESGAVVGVHCTCDETTELSRAKGRQLFWLEFASALRNACTPEDLKAVATEKLGRYLGASCVGYGEIDATGQYSQDHQDWTVEGFPGAVGTHRLDDFKPLKAQQLRAGKTVVVRDVEDDPLTAGQVFQASYKATSCKAFINAPLVKEGRLSALFVVRNAEPRAWTDSEQALVEEVAEWTWSALRRWQAELDLRQSSQALDHRTIELMHSENALRQSQKLETLGQLTGGVSHDVNNLLAVVNASAELLRAPGLAEEQRGQYLNRIIETVARAAKLTCPLLAFARQQPLSTEVFDVGQHLLEVIDLVSPLLGQGVKIDLVGCEEKSCLAEADINQFETAMINLLVNARDAMDSEGRITVHIGRVDRVPKALYGDAQTGVQANTGTGHFVEISVRDTGCGIAADQLEAIFKAFHTTKKAGKGTGLGLSQVFDFARQSGGQIAVTSKPEQGAVFTLSLPRVDIVPLPAVSTVPPETGANGPASNDQTSSLAVLVVEDSNILGEMTCEILISKGYRCLWVASGAAALAMLGTDGAGFDLVFSDVVMPGMNGIELGMELRRRHPGIPVVLTSGYNAAMSSEEKYGFDLVLKPYTLDTLTRAFDRALAGKL